MISTLQGDPSVQNPALCASDPSRELIVRSNRPRRGTCLYPEHSDFGYLCVETFDSASLIDLGRIASLASPPLSPVAYLACGDLAGDRVLRCLERTLTVEERVGPSWFVVPRA